MSLALELNTAARTLMGVASSLSKGASSAGSLSDDLVRGAQLDLTSGALAVRGLGGPYFARQAEGMFTAAKGLDSVSPTSINNAVREAMSGATALLTRATYR